MEMNFCRFQSDLESSTTLIDYTKNRAPLRKRDCSIRRLNSEELCWITKEWKDERQHRSRSQSPCSNFKKVATSLKLKQTEISSPCKKANPTLKDDDSEVECKSFTSQADEIMKPFADLDESTVFSTNMTSHCSLNVSTSLSDYISNSSISLNASEHTANTFHSNATNENVSLSPKRTKRKPAIYDLNSPQHPFLESPQKSLFHRYYSRQDDTTDDESTIENDTRVAVQNIAIPSLLDQNQVQSTSFSSLLGKSQTMSTQSITSSKSKASRKTIEVRAPEIDSSVPRNIVCVPPDVSPQKPTRKDSQSKLVLPRFESLASSHSVSASASLSGRSADSSPTKPSRKLSVERFVVPRTESDENLVEQMNASLRDKNTIEKLRRSHKSADGSFNISITDLTQELKKMRLNIQEINESSNELIRSPRRGKRRNRRNSGMMPELCRNAERVSTESLQRLARETGEANLQEDPCSIQFSSEQSEESLEPSDVFSLDNESFKRSRNRKRAEKEKRKIEKRQSFDSVESDMTGPMIRNEGDIQEFSMSFSEDEIIEAPRTMPDDVSQILDVDMSSDLKSAIRDDAVQGDSRYRQEFEVSREDLLKITKHNRLRSTRSMGSLEFRSLMQYCLSTNLDVEQNRSSMDDKVESSLFNISQANEKLTMRRYQGKDPIGSPLKEMCSDLVVAKRRSKSAYIAGDCIRQKNAAVHPVGHNQYQMQLEKDFDKIFTKFGISHGSGLHHSFSAQSEWECKSITTEVTKSEPFSCVTSNMEDVFQSEAKHQVGTNAQDHKACSKVHPKKNWKRGLCTTCGKLVSRIRSNTQPSSPGKLLRK